MKISWTITQSASKHSSEQRYAPVLPYRLSEMEKLAKEAAELSITVPGVQPKLSLGMDKNRIGKWASGTIDHNECFGRKLHFETTKC
jgi:hypothetical protein